MASTNKKWTEAEAAEAAKQYEDGKTPTEIGEALGFSYRQVIGKLVTLKKYKAPEKPTPTPRDLGPTKAQICAAITDQADFSMVGGENASKAFMERLADKFGVTVPA